MTIWEEQYAPISSQTSQNGIKCTKAKDLLSNLYTVIPSQMQIIRLVCDLSTLAIKNVLSIKYSLELNLILIYLMPIMNFNNCMTLLNRYTYNIVKNLERIFQ